MQASSLCFLGFYIIETIQETLNNALYNASNEATMHHHAWIHVEPFLWACHRVNGVRVTHRGGSIAHKTTTLENLRLNKEVEEKLGCWDLKSSKEFSSPSSPPHCAAQPAIEVRVTAANRYYVSLSLNLQLRSSMSSGLSLPRLSLLDTMHM
ncbi:hypothetical protein JHK85_007480 [Glycine max]|nr:hypothetical protein JHK85_007480 [Glycine max]